MGVHARSRNSSVSADAGSRLERGQGWKILLRVNLAALMIWVTFVLMALSQQSPGPDWEPVPADQFLQAYGPAAKKLEDFYGNCTFEVVQPASSVRIQIKTLDGQWFSSKRHKDDPEIVQVIRADGQFDLAFDSDLDAWVPRYASARLLNYRSVIGDSGFGAFFDTSRRLTYFDVVRADPLGVKVFRKGQRYRICYQQELQQDGSTISGDMYHELDADRGWACVESGCLWSDVGVVEPAYYHYREEAADGVPILERWEAEGHPEQSLLIKNFQAKPADPSVFKITTYGLPASLLQPKNVISRPRWDWLASPVTLAIGGVLFIFVAYRLRRA